MEYIPVWLKNICDIKLDNKEIEKINFPKSEYMRYITFKSMQYFGIIGLIRGAYPDRNFWVIAGGTSAVTKKRILLMEMAKAGKSWCLFGLCVGPFISMFMMHGLRMSEIYKICYKLRHDRAEIRRDRWSIVGGASGTTVGFVSGLAFKLAYSSTLGCITGMSVGCLASIAYSFVLEDYDTDSN